MLDFGLKPTNIFSGNRKDWTRHSSKNLSSWDETKFGHVEKILPFGYKNYIVAWFPHDSTWFCAEESKKHLKIKAYNFRIKLTNGTRQKNQQKVQTIHAYNAIVGPPYWNHIGPLECPLSIWQHSPQKMKAPRTMPEVDFETNIHAGMI